VKIGDAKDLCEALSSLIRVHPHIRKAPLQDFPLKLSKLDSAANKDERDPPSDVFPRRGDRKPLQQSHRLDDGINVVGLRGCVTKLERPT
jgi:hypothetical protein